MDLQLSDCHTHTFTTKIRERFSDAEFLALAQEYQRDGGPDRPPQRSHGYRRDERTLKPAEQAAFREAVLRLVEEGTYERFVLTHADGGHHMHGGKHSGMLGYKRFLPWHRAFLYKFELKLLSAHEANGGDPSLLRGIPYWRWNVEDPSFPGWLDGFLPMSRNPFSGASIEPRAPGAHGALPTPGDVHWILHRSHEFLPDSTAAVDEHLRFSRAIEGVATRHNNSDVIAHDHVHRWVGGVFELVMYSPCDPIFWLLHAEVDRLWHIWQREHPNARPELRGKNDVLTPWPLATADVHNIADLGYRYDADTA